MMADCVQSRYNSIDPDIAGPGVRTSFYVQAFILVFLVDRSWEDAPITLWTFIAMSFGLTVASIVNRDHINLLEALAVSNLVWLANIGIFIALASYSRQKANSRKAKTERPSFDYGVKFGAIAQTLLTMSLTVYLWTHIDTFGIDDCEEGNSRTNIRYVFFVGAVPVLGPGKVAGLVCSSIATAIYVIVSLRELYAFYRCRNKIKKKVDDSREKSPSPTTQPPAPLPSPLSSPLHVRGTSNVSLLPPQLSVSNSRESGETPLTSTQRKASRRPKRRRWSSDLDPMTIGISICHIMVWVYLVVSNERLLTVNGADDGYAIGFGQIVALVVVIPSILAVFSAFRRNRFRRLSAKKIRHKRRGHRHNHSEPTASEIV